ncbi:spermidine N1-acetyltransferase [Bacillus sp. ISL-32]|nr:spermidine N1-acetyltransferase [Bacillus sp. ISL-32]
MHNQLKLRPLEREDLAFVHRLNNDAKIMSYWFEEPYEAFVELQDLYDKHIHDQSERRFIVEKDTEMVGLVELVEIDYIHRRAEFQIIIDPRYQGNGYSIIATYLAMNYAFSVLNLHKLYLIVDEENTKAIHLYKKSGFSIESELQDEFFVDGFYHNAIRMCIFQKEFLTMKQNRS